MADMPSFSSHSSPLTCLPALPASLQGGYRGFYARNFINLDPWKVQDIHKR